MGDFVFTWHDRDGAWQQTVTHDLSEMNRQLNKLRCSGRPFTLEFKGGAAR